MIKLLLRLVETAKKAVKKGMIVWFISKRDMLEINHYIMNLPIEGANPRIEVFNKHLQDVLWTFWFGEPLHKTQKLPIN